MRKSAVGLLGAGVLTALFVPWSMQSHGRVAQSWWDFAHVPAFALLTAMMLLAWDIRKGRRILAGILVLVPLVEWVQSMTGREASGVDMLYGWAGAFMGAWFAAAVRRECRPLKAGGAAALLLAAALVFPVWTERDFRRQQNMFPELSRFDSWRERSRWSIASCDVVIQNGWQVTIRGDIPYPALFLRDFPSDWSGMNRLCFDIRLEGNQPLEMWTRVDDQPGDPPYGQRFQQTILLHPGDNRICLPRSDFELASGGRIMDLESIQRFGIFFHARDAGRTVRLQRMYLEP